MRATSKLRSLLATGKTLFVPGCYNALSAKILETVRFKDHPLGNVHRFAGFDQVRQWEEEYLPAEEMDKYADSVGHQPARS